MPYNMASNRSANVLKFFTKQPLAVISLFFLHPGILLFYPADNL
jgi:hypothetical protein